MSESESVVNLESLDPQNNEQVHYVFDDTELNLEDINSEDINEIMLADGSRAVLINGTILPYLDTQSMVLQHEEEQNLYDETMGQSNDEQSTVTTTKVIQYLDDSNDSTNIEDVSNEAQIVYINDEIYNSLSNGADISNYQISEVQGGEDNDFMTKMVQYDSEGIDLEELIRQQAVLRTDNLSYQYAVLKDGKLHLQNCEPNENAEELKQFSTNDTNIDKTNLTFVNQACDVSSITGKDLITGETVTLDSYINKLRRKKLQNKNLYSVSNGVKTTGNNRKRTRTINKDCDGFRSLLHKRIPLGQTEDGKMLIGKIINIKKKCPAKETVENVIETIDLVDDDPTQEDQQLLELPNNETATPSIEQSVATVPITPLDSSGAIHASKNLEVGSALNSEEGLTRNEKKIVIQEVIVTRDCFQHISRTLAGLMNMESVRKKLQSKNIVVKVIEKTFSEATKGYSRKVSYSSGFMAEEYVIGEDEQMEEIWKFIPDTNTKETLFGSNSETDTDDSGYAETTNVTVIITIAKNGERTIRVVLDPECDTAHRCRLCSKGFGSKVQLRVHVNNYHGSKTNNAQEGSQESQTEKSQQLEEVLTPPTDGSTYIFKCDECDKKFYSFSSLVKHKSSHESRNFECTLCSFRCTNEASFKKHLLRHNRTEQFICEFCLKSFANFGDLNFHRRTHDPYKYFACKVCGRAFSRQSNLQRHVAIHKGAGALYRCVICGCSYHYISSLTRHVVQNHVDVSRQHVFSQSTVENADNATEAVYNLTQHIEENVG